MTGSRHFSIEEDISNTDCDPENSELVELAPVDPEELQVTLATSPTSNQTHDQIHNLDQTEAVDTYSADEL